VARHREGGVMHQHLKEIGSRRFQRDLKGVLVHRLDRELVFRHLALGDGLGIADRPQDEGVVRRGRGVEQPLPGPDEILRGQGCAVGPDGIGAQFESVGLAVVADGPAFGHTGAELSVRAGMNQPFKEIDLDEIFGNARGSVRIERFRLGAVTALQHRFGLSA
jgi:hypothetical protein